MLEIHQHYTLGIGGLNYLFLCTKYRPDAPDVFLCAEGWMLWVAEDGRLWPYVDKRIYPAPTPYTVADLVVADDIESIGVSPNDSGFWLDPECKSPNQLRVSMPFEIEDALRDIL
jgi:hypothetical protein